MSEKMTAEEALEQLAAYHVPSESGQDLLSTIHSELEALRKDAEIKRLALEEIRDYWNRDANEQAMKDACWHAIEIADAALEADNG